MDRRRFLTLLAVCCSGCLTRRPGDTGRATSHTTTSTATTPAPRPPVTNATRTAGGDSEWLRPSTLESEADPFATFVVGNGVVRPLDVEPHYVVVENQGTEARDIHIRVRDRDAEEPAVNTTEQFLPGGLLTLELAEPAAFDVSVTVGGETTAVSIVPSQFECNDSTTGIYVREDETVEDETVSTMMGCTSSSS